MAEVSQKIKILFVSESASLGGAPRVILDIIKNLSRDSFDIHIVFLNDGPAQEEAKRHARVHSIIYKPISNHLIELQKTYRKLPWLTRKLAKLIQLINPNIIHHNGLPPQHLLTAYKQNNQPLVIHIHGLHGSDTFQNTHYIEQLLERTAHFISCAADVSRTASMCMGIPQSKIKTIYNGIELNDQIPLNNFRVDNHLLPNHKLIGGAGSFTFAKGVDRFVNIAESLLEIDDNYRFVWFGSSPDDDHFQKSIKLYISQKKLSDYFIFPGHVYSLSEYLPSLQAFIKCSRFEATPMVILESMQQGVPVVAYNVGGISEMLPHNKYLIANGNQNQLVFVLHHLLQNKDEIDELISRQYKQIKDLFLMSRAKNEFENLIVNLVERI